MKLNKKSKNNLIKEEILPLLKNKFFYLGIFLFILGTKVNGIAQTYLYNLNMKNGPLPHLSDLILDNLPYLEISFLYDWASALSSLLLIVYIIHKKKYKEIPYYLIVASTFIFLRSLFIILTPLGNPPNFNGSKSVLKGFNKYEYGVFPSGHTGQSFLGILFSKGIYRFLIAIMLILIISSLFLSRGHYSIDVLSGILFSYALYKFSEKYIKNKIVK